MLRELMDRLFYGERQADPCGADQERSRTRVATHDPSVERCGAPDRQEQHDPRQQPEHRDTESAAHSSRDEDGRRERARLRLAEEKRRTEDSEGERESGPSAFSSVPRHRGPEPGRCREPGSRKQRCDLKEVERAMKLRAEILSKPRRGSEREHAEGEYEPRREACRRRPEPWHGAQVRGQAPDERVVDLWSTRDLHRSWRSTLYARWARTLRAPVVVPARWAADSIGRPSTRRSAIAWSCSPDMRRSACSSCGFRWPSPSTERSGGAATSSSRACRARRRCACSATMCRAMANSHGSSGRVAS